MLIGIQCHVIHAHVRLVYVYMYRTVKDQIISYHVLRVHMYIHTQQVYRSPLQNNYTETPHSQVWFKLDLHSSNY